MGYYSNTIIKYKGLNFMKILKKCHLIYDDNRLINPNDIVGSFSQLV